MEGHPLCICAHSINTPPFNKTPRCQHTLSINTPPFNTVSHQHPPCQPSLNFHSTSGRVFVSCVLALLGVAACSLDEHRLVEGTHTHTRPSPHDSFKMIILQ